MILQHRRFGKWLAAHPDGKPCDLLIWRTEPFGGAVCDRHFFHPNVVCNLERYFFHAFTALFERDLGAGRQGFFP